MGMEKGCFFFLERMVFSGKNKCVLRKFSSFKKQRCVPLERKGSWASGGMPKLELLDWA